MTISLSSPDITQAEIDLVNQVLHTPRLSMGPMLDRFEALVADLIGTQHAVAVSSGTGGLHLALIAAGVGPGDLVLTTPFSFVASANCILYRQAVPIFVDIDPQTLNMDPALAAETVSDLMSGSGRALPWLPPALQDTRRTLRDLKALLPVHVFGQPCHMGPLMELAAQYQLRLVEDACEALGAEYEHRRVGALGDCAVFAFYPNKQMTTGEGGIITTNEGRWADLFRSLRNQGRDESATWLNHVRLGYNYRMDELSAALGVAQLERIEELLARRSQVAAWYDQHLVQVDGVSPPVIAPTTTRMSWFVYVVRLAPELQRDAVMERLSRQGIPSRPYFPPIHLQPLYQERFGYHEGAFPITEGVARTTLALPFHGQLTEDEVAQVCRALEIAIGGS
jgi:perosamine synthetase